MTRLYCVSNIMVITIHVITPSEADDMRMCMHKYALVVSSATVMFKQASWVVLLNSLVERHSSISIKSFAWNHTNRATSKQRKQKQQYE